MRGRGLESRDLGEMPPVRNVLPVKRCQDRLPACLTFILSPIVLLHRFFSLFKLSARNLPRKERGRNSQVPHEWEQGWGPCPALGGAMEGAGEGTAALGTGESLGVREHSVGPAVMWGGDVGSRGLPRRGVT